MTEIKIIKNALPEETMKKIEDMFFSNTFTWGYSNSNAGNDEESYLYHFFYNMNTPCSPYYAELLPLLTFMKPLSLIGIRANMYINKNKKCFGGWHNDDWGNDKLNHTTSIFYVNTNNGETEFKTGETIKSERNKLMVFPAKLEHRAISQTDKDRKICINLNYF
jgi:hypothetical protein